MSSYPLISVIIPTYNREVTIQRAIDCVLSQTYRNFEIIVIDDGSTDNTKEIIRQYIGKIKYYYQDNAGPSKARNMGINEAKGEWIAFLDSDDWWFQNKLEIQLEEAIKSKCEACFHDVVYCDIDGYIKNIGNINDYKHIIGNKILSEFSRQEKSILFNDAYRQFMISKQIFLTSTLLIKTNAIKSVGKFSDNFRSSEDYELYYRLAVNNRILHIYNKLALYNFDPKRIYDMENIYLDRIKAIKKSLQERILENDYVLSPWAKIGLLYQLRCLSGYYRKSMKYMEALMTYWQYIKYYFTPYKYINK